MMIYYIIELYNLLRFILNIYVLIIDMFILHIFRSIIPGCENYGKRNGEKHGNANNGRPRVTRWRKLYYVTEISMKFYRNHA